MLLFIEIVKVCGAFLNATVLPQQIYSHSLYFEESYPKDEKCNWNIRTDKSKCVRLYFEEFQLEGHIDVGNEDDCEFVFIK